jgi:hypothetical protein
MRFRWALVLVALLLGGCNIEWRREHVLACRPDERLLVRDTLYFGAALPDGSEVDAGAWRQFEDDALAPAFPDGYSVVPARGTWRDSTGATTSESSRIFIVVHADTAASAKALRDIAARYRERFHQQAVLHEHGVVCARF